MIRDTDQIRSNVQYIESQLNNGNPDAIMSLPQQIVDMLDTLQDSPDRMIRHMLMSRITQLEFDKRALEENVRILTVSHNTLIDEFNKVKRILEFAMGQKENKDV